MRPMKCGTSGTIGNVTGPVGHGTLLNVVILQYILSCNQALDADLDKFLYHLNQFVTNYFRPVSPFEDHQHLILHPQNPPPLPYPFSSTVPLRQQK